MQLPKGFKIEAFHPDAFLMDQRDVFPGLTLATLTASARPPCRLCWRLAAGGRRHGDAVAALRPRCCSIVSKELGRVQGVDVTGAQERR